MLYKITLIFLIILLLLITKSPSSGHSVENDFRVLYNGEEGIANEINQSIPTENFFPTEEKAPQVFRTGDELVLSVEPKGGYSIENVTWDTGSLSGELSGEQVVFTLNKAGSYPVALSVFSEGEILTHSVLVTVTGKDNFSFPEINLLVNASEIESEPVEIDLTKAVLFEAKTENSKGLKFIWNFDNGETREGQSVTYKFPENPYFATPILRVIDNEGIYQDIQFTLKNSSFGSEGAQENKDYTFILVATMIFLVVLVFGFVKAKKYLKKRV